MFSTTFYLVCVVYHRFLIFDWKGLILYEITYRPIKCISVTPPTFIMFWHIPHPEWTSEINFSQVWDQSALMLDWHTLRVLFTFWSINLHNFLWYMCSNSFHSHSITSGYYLTLYRQFKPYLRNRVYSSTWDLEEICWQMEGDWQRSWFHILWVGYYWCSAISLCHWSGKLPGSHVIRMERVGSHWCQR